MIWSEQSAGGRRGNGLAGHPTIVVALALTAAAVRLIPLHFLHPLQWDELEFYRATSWIASGWLPFRDFWEHHTPLTWFLFAPFTLLTDTPGVGAIVLLRWVQIPVWIATFALVNLWMRNAGIERFARWSATTLALASSLLMTPAIEYRVEAVACALLMGGLVLAQRERYFLAGIVFCLAGFANLRFGPVLVVSVLSILVVHRRRALPIVAGGSVALSACLAFFAATGSLAALWQQVWIGNLAERFATPVTGGFLHRLLVPFGIRLLASDRVFDVAAVDVGGVCILLFGLAGLVIGFTKRGDLRLMAVVQLMNVLFVAYMKFTFNYHLVLIAILMIPLIAAFLENEPRRSVVVAVLVLAWSVGIFASLFRGKELDRAYQDLIMTEVHARTRPGEAVFSGVAWAIRREPAYRFWFLPELARQLVAQRLAPPYVPDSPPAAVVLDQNTFVWLYTVQPDLAKYFTRHYIPIFRELWVPAMNARIAPQDTFEWIVPRDGEYRVYSSAALARHPWFRDGLGTAMYKAPDASRLTFTLPEPGAGPIRFLQFEGAIAALRKGERVVAMNTSAEDRAVILLPTNDRTLLRQPPAGVTIDAEMPRITHVPQFGAKIEP